MLPLNPIEVEARCLARKEHTMQHRDDFDREFEKTNSLIRSGFKFGAFIASIVVLVGLAVVGVVLWAIISVVQHFVG